MEERSSFRTLLFHLQSQKLENPFFFMKLRLILGFWLVLHGGWALIRYYQTYEEHFSIIHGILQLDLPFLVFSIEYLIIVLFLIFMLLWDLRA